MNEKERKRLVVLSRVASDGMPMGQAAALMELSERQAWRLYKRFVSHGAAGLVHGLRGKPSNRSSLKPKVRRRALRLYRTLYAGFGPTLASEKLGEDHDLEVDHETLRRWLLKEKLWARARRSGRHRRRRQRRSCFGEMVQMDGSHHDWFEGRGGRCVLMVMVDDATGRTYARFYAAETTAAAMDIFGRYCRRFGLPLSLYVDRDSIYRCERRFISDQEALAGVPQPLTQFGRAMKELDVKLILANSPQAKGRVERMNGTLQDRLVKELRLARIGEMASANGLLEKKFLNDLNRRFAIRPREQSDVHRPLANAPRLSEVLCNKEKRSVSKDGCVSWEGQVLEIDPGDRGRCGRQLELRHKSGAGGGIELIGIGGHRLRWRSSAGVANEQSTAKRRSIVNNKRWIPPRAHPWKATAPTRPQGPPPRLVPRVRLASAAPQRALPAEVKDDSSIELLTVTVLMS